MHIIATGWKFPPMDLVLWHSIYPLEGQVFIRADELKIWLPYFVVRKKSFDVLEVHPMAKLKFRRTKAQFFNKKICNIMHGVLHCVLLHKTLGRYAQPKNGAHNTKEIEE